ncbi:hypothetical protein J6590_094207 [Homalodisca vitripennis]|nr:hypothetical protein J6590_094207 [Homalodisca vitripennis]
MKWREIAVGFTRPETCHPPRAMQVLSLRHNYFFQFVGVARRDVVTLVSKSLRIQSQSHCRLKCRNIPGVEQFLFDNIQGCYRSGKSGKSGKSQEKKQDWKSGKSQGIRLKSGKSQGISTLVREKYKIPLH